MEPMIQEERAFSKMRIVCRAAAAKSSAHGNCR